jgi:hypothetical protein
VEIQIGILKVNSHIAALAMQKPKDVIYKTNEWA